MHLIRIRDADLGNAFDPDLGCDLGNASDPDLGCGSWECILSGSGMRILGMHLIRIRDADLGNASDPDPGCGSSWDPALKLQIKSRR